MIHKLLTSTTISTQLPALSKEDKELLSKEKGLILPRSTTLPEHVVDAIIKDVAADIGMNIPQASVAICILMQIGGCARSCDQNLEYSTELFEY